MGQHARDTAHRRRRISPASHAAPPPSPSCSSAHSDSRNFRHSLAMDCGLTVEPARFRHGIAAAELLAKGMDGAQPSSHLLSLPRRVVVEHDEVAVRHIEARQVLHRHLCIVDVLVHHEGRPSCVLGDTLRPAAYTFWRHLAQAMKRSSIEHCAHAHAPMRRQQEHDFACE